MPALAGENERGLVFGDGNPGAFLQYRLHDLGLGALTIGIQRVELFG